MASASAAKSFTSLFLGTCIPCLKHNASKFEIPYYYFDERLKMYFKKTVILFAFDAQKICKSGDIALIQELKVLPKNTSKSIRHEVVELVHQCGDVTDPITGKKVVSSRFRDEIEATNSLYGKLNSCFNYTKAPPRGWQEGKKDFSHREPYYKYHEFDENDENQHQPDSSAF